jgi:4-diphosphocytidyl-2-C-methyl-D-erythritol kinase
LNIEHHLLSQLALKLGSDVPYFLNPVPAFAESRGEIITPVNLKIDKPILIVNPGIHISTKWAFGHIKPHQPKVSLKSLISYNEIPIDDLKHIAVNDFEEVVFKKYPEIKKIKEVMIESGAILSMMTGTGSTVFGIFENKKAADEAALKFPKSIFQIYQLLTNCTFGKLNKSFCCIHLNRNTEWNSYQFFNMSVRECVKNGHL